MDLKRIVRIAMMAALIFAGTYTFKIPIAITGGYTHLGDCAIFVGVMLLGRKDGALAAALGAALSDLLSGAMLWVLPTFIIKGIMALIMGLAVEKLMPEHRYGWLIGEVLGRTGTRADRSGGGGDSGRTAHADGRPAVGGRSVHHTDQRQF